MAEVTVKVAADAVQFENTIQGVERQLREMTREFRGAEVGSQQFLKLQGDIDATQQHLQRLRGGFAQLSGRGSGSIGMAAMQMAYFVDDAQYGIRGIVNNIPQLLMSLGIGTGLTGVISILAVAANQLWEKLGAVNDELSETQRLEAEAAESTKKFTDAISAQNERLDKNAEKMRKRIELLRAQQQAAMVGMTVTGGDVEIAKVEAKNELEIEQQKQAAIEQQIKDENVLIESGEKKIEQLRKQLDLDLERRNLIAELNEIDRNLSDGESPVVNEEALRRRAEIQSSLDAIGREPLSDQMADAMRDQIIAGSKDIRKRRKNVESLGQDLTIQQEVTRGTALRGQESVLIAQIRALESQMRSQEAAIRELYAPEVQAGFSNYVEGLILQMKEASQKQVDALIESLKSLQDIEKNTRRTSATFN